MACCHLRRWSPPVSVRVVLEEQDTSKPSTLNPVLVPVVLVETQDTG